MPLVSVSVDGFLLTSTAIILPTIYYTRKSKSSGPATTPSPPLRQPLSILVLLHSLYILYAIFLRYPPNLFRTLGIPLTTPSDNIRNLLLKYAGLNEHQHTGELPTALDTLLTRLSSFDARTLYVRFGQLVIQNCDYCHSPSEYALHALPKPLLGYLRAAAVVGFVTIRGSFRERWRKFGIGVVVLMAVIEAYWILTVEVKIPRSGKGVTMWHDRFWTIRHFIFLILPPLLHILPARTSTPSPLTSLQSITTTVEQSIVGLRFFRYMHTAIMRVPETRNAHVEWWAKDRQEGQWTREDPDVARMADRLGLGYNEPTGEGEELGRLRQSARAQVEALRSGAIVAPSPSPGPS